MKNILLTLFLVPTFASALESISNEDVKCLTTALHYEANTEGRKGQLAVAEVIVNRSLKNNRSICNTIKEPYQFSFMNGRKYLPKVPKESTVFPVVVEVVFNSLTGRNTRLTAGATLYHNDDVAPNWKGAKKTVKINNHTFYKL